MKPSRWGVATGVLLPLVPGAWIAFQPVDEGSSVIALLASVVGACWIGGLTGGIAAAILGSFIYDLLVLPPRFELTLSEPALPHLIGFTVAATAVVGLYGRLRYGLRRADRARIAAERRAAALGQRVDLVAPVLDRAPIGFALVDTELRYGYVNQQLAEFTGIPAAEHLGRQVAEVYPPQARAAIEEPVRRVLQTGEVQTHATLTVPGADGDRHYLATRYPVRDADTRIVGVAVSLLDVTAQTALQERHREALAELTATVQSSPLAIALVDTQLRYKRVNKVFQELSASGAASLVGRGLTEADRLPKVVPAICREVLRTGEAAGTLDVPVGAVQVGRAAKPRADDRHLTVSCFPVRLDSGDVVAVALILIDVTDRYRFAKLEAEAGALRATAEMAYKLAEAQRLAGFGSWEMDVDTGEITWSEQMRAIAGDPEPYVTGGGRTILHPDDVERAAHHRRRLMADGVPYAEEFRLLRPDGRVVEVYATGEALRDESGRTVRLWGTLQDVTTQRASERAAREAIRSAEQARAQLETEHQALQMFVRAMLPAHLPPVADGELAAAYLPVVERVDIGGDWYDAFALPDGRIALAIGDVTGHDLRAATVMGQVRNAVRAYAIEDPSPGEVLRRVNALLNLVPDLDLVTMVYGVYDPADYQLTWANAGHPAPLLRRGGAVSTLAEPGGVMLGVLAEVRYAEGRIRLEPGDTVLWFTDGLVDNRSVDPAEALDTLAGVLAGGGAPDGLLAEVTNRMLRNGPQEDDVCLLALHRGARVPTQPRRTARPARVRKSGTAVRQASG